MTIKLVSLANVKTFMHIPDGETEWDNLLDDILIPHVTVRLEEYMNRKLLDSETDVDEYFDSDGFRTLLPLQRWPLSSVTAVYESPDRTFAAGHALDSDEYVTWDSRGLIELVDGRTFLEGVQTIKVSYQGGYTKDGSDVLESVPEDILLAAYMQIAHVWQRRTSLGTTQQSVAGGQVLTFNAALNLLPEVKAILDPHRREPL